MLLKQHYFSKDLQSCTDEDLLILYHHTADNKFFSELFSRYADLTFQVCLKYLRDIEASKDRVMHIFSQLLEKCRRQILKIKSFKSWLFICIRNECASYRRSQSKYSGRFDSYTLYFSSGNPHDVIRIYIWEDQKIHSATQHQIHQALHQLALEQRQCLQYFYFEKISYRGIAKKMGIQLKEVKSHIQNGKRNMKKLLS